MNGISTRSIELLKLLKNGEFEKVEIDAVYAMDNGYEPVFEDMAKIAKFWQARAELFVQNERRNSGELLFFEWDVFIDFCLRSHVTSRDAFVAIQTFVFKKIVEFLLDAYEANPKDSHALVLLAYAFRELGFLDKAIETLEYILSFTKEKSLGAVLAFLADLYVEKGDEETAVVMYNEAFYRYPQAIDLNKLEYNVVLKLAAMLERDNFSDKEILEWIPIYGYFYGGLSIHRKLSYSEYMLLHQKIKNLETDLYVDRSVTGVIIPRLVNTYLWAFDYFVFQLKDKKNASQIADRIMTLLDYMPAIGVLEEVSVRFVHQVSIVFSDILSAIEQDEIHNTENLEKKVEMQA